MKVTRKPALKRLLLKPPCTACGLCKFRRMQVIGRGVLPCNILFIGEAPGDVEDRFGEPFIGPSGKLFDQAWTSAVEIAKYTPTFFITNTVQCRPCDGFGEPNREPTEMETLSCVNNVMTIVLESSAIEFVAIGKVAESWCRKRLNKPFKHVRHPAFIKRIGGTSSPEYRHLISDLVTVIERVRDAEWKRVGACAKDAINKCKEMRVSTRSVTLQITIPRRGDRGEVCGGVVCTNGKVTATAPYFKFMLGYTSEKVARECGDKGWEMQVL